MEASRYFYLDTLILWNNYPDFRLTLPFPLALSPCRATGAGLPPSKVNRRLLARCSKDLIRNYPSLDAADEAALAFPGFAELAEQFQTQPFTAFCALLEAIKAYQPVLELPEGEP